MPDVVDLKFIGQRGTGADERHFAAQNVPELGQFIEAGLAQESTQRCHARIIFYFVDGRLSRIAALAMRLTVYETLDVLLMDFRIAVHIHRTELQAPKSRAKLAKPVLPENYRTFGSELDGDSDRGEHRAKDEQ